MYQSTAIARTWNKTVQTRFFSRYRQQNYSGYDARDRSRYDPRDRSRYDSRDQSIGNHAKNRHEEFEYIYGTMPINLALNAKKRQFGRLFIQENKNAASKVSKIKFESVVNLAGSLNLELVYKSKGDLNSLTDNKLHQGLVLEATPLVCDELDCLPIPSNDFKCWLALDEVMDPQNLGALIRSACYFGVDGIIVCEKNSAPLSPTVSKASAGAVELVPIYSSKNLFDFLSRSRQNGWKVFGTKADPKNSKLLKEINVLDESIVIVLGNEGFGIRNVVEGICDEFIRIESSGRVSNEDLDSLNVSVTGGIILHDIMMRHRPNQK